MGGILGKLSFDPDVRISDGTVACMTDAMAHRGTTASASYAGRGIALGWCDTVSGLCTDVVRNEDARIRAVADADLANGGDLRRQLERLGHVFDGFTDAEVMAHAYEEWGDTCVARFEGPFACAIWDEPARRLLLARDPIGIRPLCFALLHGDGVVFASEIKALLQDPAVGRDWNPEAIDAYLALGYVPAPLTIYRRVSKLEPAHTLVVEGRRLTTRQYWDFSFDPVEARTELDAIHLLASGLNLSVSAHLRDGRAGALHSGGTASGTILSVLPRDAQPTVAIGIEQPASDLERIARTTAHLGLRSEIDVATPDAAEVAQVLARHFDEPAADPSAISQYAIFAAARCHLDVALAGHGAAALWAGYARHRVERFEWDIRSLLGAPLARFGGHVGRTLGDSVKGAGVLAHLTMPPAGACAAKHAYGFFDDRWRHTVYTRTFSLQVREANPFARHQDLYQRCASPDPLTRALYVEARTYLPDNTLTIADRASAAASLELRYPFLSRRLIELSAAMPDALKLRGTTGMYALRQVLARRVPADLLPPARRLARPRPWLAEALKTLVPGVILDERFDNRGIFSRPALKALWKEHRSGERDHAHRLWSVLMLEFWFRESIDGDAAMLPGEYAVVVKAA